MYETAAYDKTNDDGFASDPVLVIVATGSHDVSRLAGLLNGESPNSELRAVGKQITWQLARHNAGRKALRLLAAHGGPDLLETVATETKQRPTHPLAQAVCGCPIYLDNGLVEHRDGCRFPAAAAAARAWNRTFEDRHLSPVGAPVRFWPGERIGEGRPGVTRAAAEVFAGHTAVVWIEGMSGCIALSHVQDATARYTDAHGEHWHPAAHDDHGQGWLRCEETDRGVRNIEAVEAEFGPLTAEAHPPLSEGPNEGEGSGVHETEVRP